MKNTQKNISTATTPAQISPAMLAKFKPKSSKLLSFRSIIFSSLLSLSTVFFACQQSENPAEQTHQRFKLAAIPQRDSQGNFVDRYITIGNLKLYFEGFVIIEGTSHPYYNVNESSPGKAATIDQWYVITEDRGLLLDSIVNGSNDLKDRYKNNPRIKTTDIIGDDTIGSQEDDFAEGDYYQVKEQKNENITGPRYWIQIHH